MPLAAPDLAQLDLFHGDHLPLIRARAALARGDLPEAHQAFALACEASGEPEASERARRLARVLLRRELAVPSAEDVHDAFEAALGSHAPGSHSDRPRAIRAGEWFRLYAAHMERALADEPTRRVRGWCALHFELAAGRPRLALATAHRIVSRVLDGSDGGRGRDGWALLEAARAAQAVEESALARRWTLLGCLASRESLEPDPPPLVPAGRSELDAASVALPRLAPDLDALFREALELELPSPASAWIPAIGALDGVFTLADLCSPEIARAADLDAQSSKLGEPAALSFLRALLAARAARTREAPARPGCGPLELRARAEMKRAAPPLFARYMNRLGLGIG